MIDQASRDKILQADLSNIVRKVKAGKPLTTAERKLVEAHADTPATPPAAPEPPDDPPRGQSGPYSINALSTITGKDRRTLAKLLVNVPPAKVDGKTKFYHLAQVEAAINSKPGASLKDKKLKEEIRKLRIFNDQKESKLVAKAEVAAAIRRALGKVSEIAESKLVNEWPNAVAGLDPTQARVYGRRLHDMLMCECQKLETEFPE